MSQLVEVERPFYRIFVDFQGPYLTSKKGNAYLLVVLDQYSLFVIFKPLRTATAKKFVDFLENYVFSLFSVPEIILSDNGKQFESNIFQNLMEKCGIPQIFPPKYFPQCNPSERSNRIVLAGFRS